MKLHLLGAFLLLAGSVSADDKKPARAGHDRLDALAEKLSLTSEQKAQLKKIDADFDKQEDPIEDQIRHLRHEEHEAAHKVLSEEQHKNMHDLLKAEMQKEMQEIAGKLGLTSKQRDSIGKIRHEYDVKIDKLGRDEKTRGQVRELRHKEFEAIRHELTDAQREKAPGIFREEMREWRDPAQRRKHMKAVMDKLDLSADQKKQLHEAHAKNDAQIDKLQAQLREVHKQEREAMNKVFTEEQRKKLDELRKGRERREKPNDN